MQDSFEIIGAAGGYFVQIGDSSLLQAIIEADASIVVADSYFKDYLADIDRPCLFIDAIEDAKELSRLPVLFDACRRGGLTRNGHIAAVGGGIIQDITCFIASTYMRGVNWTYFPTTLLSMVDSCIGGKSSINVGSFKNLVGNFYPPSKVVIVPEVTLTLPPIHIAAGRVEAAKICFARSADVFSQYLHLDTTSPDYVIALIKLSLLSKRWFIEKDEFDNAERLLLNFGHSFAHALEGCLGYAIPHGIAVGVGCLAAIAMSESLHPVVLKSLGVQRLQDHMVGILRPIKQISFLLDNVRQSDFAGFWDADKKHNNTSYRPILLGDEAILFRANLSRSTVIKELAWHSFVRSKYLLN